MQQTWESFHGINLVLLRFIFNFPFIVWSNKFYKDMLFTVFVNFYRIQIIYCLIIKL